MRMDPVMPYLTGAILAIVALGLVLRRLKQPLIVGYLLAGVALGPHGLDFFSDPEFLNRVGAFGVLLLLFFVGMEVQPSALISRWRVAVIGTGLQILFSVACVAGLGLFLDWPLPRIVLLGFVISLSSTAVVLRLLKERAADSPGVAQDVTAVLLAQDLAVIPMIIVIGVFRGDAVSIWVVSAQAVAGLLLMLFVLWVCRKDTLGLHLNRKALMDDEELQVFVSLFFLFAFAMIASLLNLSAALGAFTAGILVGAAKETHSFHEHLKSFEVVFVAAFFCSVGALIDVTFITEHWWSLGGLVLLVLLTNTLINAVVLKLLRTSWRDSLYAGSFLAQVGEFSFVLALMGYEAKIVGVFGYQMTLALISLSLLLSPAWIELMRRLTRRTTALQ
jgi:CPA2 family monovalent cation:H+ antiporter-2